MYFVDFDGVGDRRCPWIEPCMLGTRSKLSERQLGPHFKTF